MRSRSLAARSLAACARSSGRDPRPGRSTHGRAASGETRCASSPWAAAARSVGPRLRAPRPSTLSRLWRRFKGSPASEGLDRSPHGNRARPCERTCAAGARVEVDACSGGVTVAATELAGDRRASGAAWTTSASGAARSTRITAAATAPSTSRRTGDATAVELLPFRCRPRWSSSRTWRTARNRVAEVAQHVGRRPRCLACSPIPALTRASSIQRAGIRPPGSADNRQALARAIWPARSTTPRARSRTVRHDYDSDQATIKFGTARARHSVYNKARERLRLAGPGGTPSAGTTESVERAVPPLKALAQRAAAVLGAVRDLVRSARGSRAPTVHWTVRDVCRRMVPPLKQDPDADKYQPAWGAEAGQLDPLSQPARRSAAPSRRAARLVHRCRGGLRRRPGRQAVVLVVHHVVRPTTRRRSSC